MEINATITSRSGLIACAVTRTDLPRKIVSRVWHEAPLVYWREWGKHESVVIEIRDPGEGK